MFSQTRTVLQQFDNEHDFEWMCADILNALEYKDVVLIAPQGGSDASTSAVQEITLFDSQLGIKSHALPFSQSETVVARDFKQIRRVKGFLSAK